MKKITAAIASLKISSKIWLCMISISLTLSLFIGLLNGLYFIELYKEDTYAQTADTIQIGSQSLEDSYLTLLKNVISFASSSEFEQLVSNVRSNNQDVYIRNKAMIQESLSNLSVSHPLLDSVAILGKNGEFYSVFSNTLKRDYHPSQVFDWDISSVHGITWLPQRKSPYIQNNDIIPVIVPIQTLTDARYLCIADTAADAEVFILLMLDSKHVSQRLALSISTYTDKFLYVAGSDGTCISLSAQDPWYETANNPDMAKKIAENRNYTEISLLEDGLDYSIYTKPLNFCGLTLVEILPKSALHNRIFRMNALLAMITFLGLLMAAFLSFLLSRFVTKPFTQLIKNIKNIENNTYDTPYQMKYQDEVGLLSTAINSMHATILQQFESLKQSERAKYRSEIQLLAEQINPHFLYNTLECINMEVLGGHRETASDMITSLGDFLRIGLNYGHEIIPLSKELTHVKAYIDIMNHRLSKKISLNISVAHELEQISLLKFILQPLVENSIRHGFTLEDRQGDMILMPEINIRVYQNDAALFLSVSDNGHGIDIQKATDSLCPTPASFPTHHVGLRNVYQRLNTYYGKVSITFSTIPYYQNEVLIAFPASAYQSFLFPQPYPDL